SKFPGGEGSQVERELIHAGSRAIVDKLELVLHLVARDRLITDDAGGADTGAARRPIGVSPRQLSTPKDAACLRTESCCIVHRVAPERTRPGLRGCAWRVSYQSQMPTEPDARYVSLVAPWEGSQVYV